MFKRETPCHSASAPTSSHTRRGPRRSRLAALLLPMAILVVTPALADSKAGYEAWQRRDYATAVRLWQGPAAAGDADTEFNLGQAYKLGYGVKQDLARAEQLFGHAAAQGHKRASDNYGVLLYQRGARAEAMPYIIAGAGRGYPPAECALGIAYFNGEVVARDWVRAYAYESLAQQAGVPQARSALAQMDTYIPTAQRQQGVAMATELASEAQANHDHELASAELGAPAPPPPPAYRAPPQPSYAPPPPQAYASPDQPGAGYAPVEGDPGAPPPTEQRPHPRPVASMPAEPAPAAGGGWKIQLGAFSVAANAEAQWARARGMAGVAGHRRVLVSSGRVTRLLATGFSEGGAHAACARLSGAGIDCIVTRD